MPPRVFNHLKMGGFPKRKPPVNDQEHSVNTASLNVNKHK